MLERHIILSGIDKLWQEHLYNMDALREGVHLRAQGQKDPLIEYKREAFEMFARMVERIKEQTLSFLYRVQVTREEEVERLEEERRRRHLRLVYSRGEEGEAQKPKKQPIRRGRKIGRNDPCPCGSGKKYKKCCGRPGAKPKQAQMVH
jgi:preprotein translocase subunit SecA